MLGHHLILIQLLWAGLPAWQAAGPGSAGPRANVEPKADQTLRRMSAYLAKSEKFSFEAYDMHDQILDTGQKIQLANTRTIRVKRPNMLYADLSGDIDNERVWYNGKTLTLLDKGKQVYGVMDVPDTIDATMDHVVRTFGDPIPLADVLFSDPYQGVIGHVRQGNYLGLHDVRGKKCHHLAFRQPGIDWQIWIADGDAPVPRKLVITYKDYPGQPQYIAFLGKWNMAPEFPEGLFTAKIPDGVKPIDIMQLRGRSAPDSSRRDDLKSKPRQP